MAFLLLTIACSEHPSPDRSCRKLKSNTHAINDYGPFIENKGFKAVIEISSGDRVKYEADKKTGLIVPEKINNKPRVIDYLGYPANYGFFPGTVLSADEGGDGDPLDVFILGERQLNRSICDVEIIGGISFSDNNETDDKIIAYIPTEFNLINPGIPELQKQYPGILKILRTWLLNYKRSPGVIMKGLLSRDQAVALIQKGYNSFNRK